MTNDKFCHAYIITKNLKCKTTKQLLESGAWHCPMSGLTLALPTTAPLTAAAYVGQTGPHGDIAERGRAELPDEHNMRQ